MQKELLAQRLVLGLGAAVGGHRAIRQLHAKERRDAADADRHAGAAGHFLKLVAQGFAAFVELLVDLRRKLAHGGQTGLHGHGIAVEGAAVRDGGRPLGGVEGRHDVGSAAERPHGHAAADDLAETTHVRDDVVPLLGAAGGHAQRLHLVEDEQRPLSVARLAQRFQERRLGGHVADAGHDRLDDHRGQVVSVLRDDAPRRRGVVERDDDHVVQRLGGQPLRARHRTRGFLAPRLRHAQRHADAGVVTGAVIGSLRFGDFRLAGKRPRRPQRQRHALRAAVRKAQLLQGGHRRGQQAGQFHLRLGRVGEGGTLVRLRLQRRGDLRIAVPEDQRGGVVVEIEALVAVHVAQHAALAVLGVERKRLEKGR